MSSHTNLKEKVLHSEVVFQGRFLKVNRDQVQLPNGDISHREYIKHPGASVILPVDQQGFIYVVYQYRHALKKVFLELPAGKRDSGEEPLKTAHRELLEETGFKASRMDLMTVIHPVIGYADEEMYLYLAQDLIPGPSKLDPGENLEVVKMSSEELKKLVQSGQVSDVKTLIGLFWYWNYLEKEKS